MAISTNGGSNPTKVTYNGKNCTEVWYKSWSRAEAVKVWPDDVYFTWVGLHRDANKNFFPDHIYVQTNADATPWTDDLTAQHTGEDKALVHDFTTKPGVGFDFSTYGEWTVNSVSIMVNKPTKGPVDKWYQQTVTGNRNTLAKAIKVTYENGAFWLKNVQEQPINLTNDLPNIMGPIEKFTAIEFDIGLCAWPHGSNPGMEIRFYFKDWEPEPTPEPTPPEPITKPISLKGAGNGSTYDTYRVKLCTYPRDRALLLEPWLLYESSSRTLLDFESPYKLSSKDLVPDNMINIFNDSPAPEYWGAVIHIYKNDVLVEEYDLNYKHNGAAVGIRTPGKFSPNHKIYVSGNKLCLDFIARTSTASTAYSTLRHIEFKTVDATNEIKKICAYLEPTETSAHPNTAWSTLNIYMYF